MKRGAVWLVAATFAMASLVAACGDDDEDTASGGGSTTEESAAAATPARSRSCCPTRSRRSAGRRSTARSCRRRSRTPASRPTIQNAEGDKATQQQQAEQAITNGAKVILLVNLDSGSGAAIEAQRRSRRASRSSTTTA